MILLDVPKLVRKKTSSISLVSSNVQTLESVLPSQPKALRLKKKIGNFFICYESEFDF